MDKPVKVTLKAEPVYTAAMWHPEGNISGPSMGGIQASHGNSFCLYLDVKGKRTEVLDGDFIVYRNDVVDEVMKPAAFVTKFNGIAVPLTVAEESQMAALEAKKTAGKPPLTPAEEATLTDLKTRKAMPPFVPEPVVAAAVPLSVAEESRRSSLAAKKAAGGVLTADEESELSALEARKAAAEKAPAPAKPAATAAQPKAAAKTPEPSSVPPR
jgi:hypothetical protein